MLTIPACYLYASAVALRVAAFSYEKDRRHAVQIAAVLFAGCAAYNLTTLGDAWWLWPPMDAITAWFVAIRCRIAYRPWKLLIILALGMQMACHVKWQIGDKFGGSAYAYHLTLNLIYLVQLAAVSSSGSRRVRTGLRNFVASRIGRRHRRGVNVLRRAEPTRPHEGRKPRR